MPRTSLRNRLIYKTLLFISPFAICSITLFPLLLLVLSKPSTQSPYPYVENRSAETDSDGQCGFQGDNDTYGLGIRLSLYIQWLTFIIICGFVMHEARSIRGITNCFQGAMFIALIYITATKGSELYAVETYIVFSFCAAGGGAESLISGVVAELSHAEDYDDMGQFLVAYMMHPGAIIQYLLAAGLHVYGVWFFFTGMDKMKHPPCSTSIFFFSRVNAYHWIRTSMKVFFTIPLVGLVVVFLVFIFSKNLRVVRDTSNAESTTDSDPNVRVIGGQSSRAQTAVAISPGPASRCATCGRWGPAEGPTCVWPEDLDFLGGTAGSAVTVLTLGFLRAIFVVTIEKTILWNNIRGVNGIGSTGQLLPLIIAGGGLCTTLHTWYKLKTKSK